MGVTAHATGDASGVSLDAVADLLVVQDGVVSRAQLLGAGLTKSRVDTLIRRRELVAVLPGAYVNHTGTPTWSQRAWAAVLYAGPAAALHLGSALHLAADHRGVARPDPVGPVHVAVDWTRRVQTRPGLRIHRVRGLAGMVRWNASPPRLRVELAALEVAHRARDDLAAISALADVVGARRTTAEKLRTAAAARTRLRRRSLLLALVEDLDAGTQSVLEHGFLTRVVRPHGLLEPSVRQAPRTGARGREYRDVEYDDLGLAVELDGVTHDTATARADDADRDLDDLASGRVVGRLRYRQVFGTPCRTAAQLAAVFRGRGWEGTASACGPACDLADPT
ncbi:hypothetical protein [Nocardioides sp. Soil777]|uniref:hypothetical protein n=1 Tax=Nocardioides sp. Soil777 TaxID=1736409 RepID=UPI0012FAED09|nr:hypothetical protein [Nocardioides sp. Soil777]